MTTSNLPHFVSFVIGVANCDYGHKQNRYFHFEMNRTNDEVVSAFRKTVRSANLDITKLFLDWQQDVMPQAFIDRARAALQAQPEAIELLDYIEHECDGRVEFEGHMDMYLYLAKASDPDMTWKRSEHHVIDLGGYGLFLD